MTLRLLGLGFVSAWLVVALPFAACNPRSEGLDRSTLPDHVRSDYDVFARKCSKCHSLARPLTSGITDDEQWERYVTRMRRQPGSGISREDEEVILRFLHYYAAEQRREKAEKNGLVPASSSSALSPSPSPSTPPSPSPSPSPPSAAISAEGGAP